MSDLRVSMRVGATLNLGNYETVRIEVGLDGLDPALDLTEQLATAEPTIERVSQYVIAELRKQALAARAGMREGGAS